MDREKYIELFSKERIDSYQSIEEHNENLRFIQEISLILGLIELIMRNKIDKLMIEKMGNNWIFDLIEKFKPRLEDADNKLKPIEKRLFNNITNIIRKFEKENQVLLHSQIISRLNFGFWVDMVFYIIDYRKFDCRKLMNIINIKFEKYDFRNRLDLEFNMKIKYLLKLIQEIRNRAFHWENLLKEIRVTNFKNKNIIVSGIYVRYSKVIVTITPNKIKKYLDDALNCFDSEIIKEIEEFKNRLF